MTKKRIIGLHALLMIILSFFVSALCLTAKAETVNTENEENSISVHIKHENTPLANVKYKLYKIADGNHSGNYTATEQFKNYPLAFNFLDSSTFDGLVTTLEGYIDADKLEPGYTADTDESGTAKFDNLPDGAYLLTGETYTVDDTIKVFPSSTLVFLPFKDSDGQVNSQAVIESKFKVETTEKDETAVTVYKVWKDNDNSDKKRPTQIEAELFKDGVSYDTVVLNDKNNWRHTWNGLPGGCKWTVKEKTVVSDYTVNIEQNDDSFIITNSKLTTVPPNNRETLPQTGMLWWPIPLFTVLGLALICAGVVYWRVKK